ncbi:hypothetical protein [Salmonella bongori]|uniref:Uncharacterized protein n=3 Tax=Salmonella TaxID=590 RepID=A0A750P329_SALER|nr:hypothetical protein [Salmonella bongori]EGS1128928.1 hypothetical protein [Salmonella bongori CFSAN000509]AGR60847.1 hypothetical protein A464_3663 [Salmonella bongori N268-08]EDP8562422.1 hypothetical protein [Salmonella bongori]EDP8574983.1 hypothetical protein [Salmonella bongori]EDP8593382.1 hypothetical protein [Salmonella bongori]
MMTTLLPDFTTSSSFTFFSSERTFIVGLPRGLFIPFPLIPDGNLR